jgi:hypothetical protein
MVYCVPGRLLRRFQIFFFFARDVRQDLRAKLAPAQHQNRFTTIRDETAARGSSTETTVEMRPVKEDVC